MTDVASQSDHDDLSSDVRCMQSDLDAFGRDLEEAQAKIAALLDYVRVLHNTLNITYPIPPELLP